MAHLTSDCCMGEIFKDFQRAEWTAVPLALGILLVAFGALLAAVLPVGLALTSFLAADGLLALSASGWRSTARPAR